MSVLLRTCISLCCWFTLFSSLFFIDCNHGNDDDDDGFEILDELEAAQAQTQTCTSCGTPNSRQSQTQTQTQTQAQSQQKKKKAPPSQEDLMKYVEQIQEQKELEDQQEALHAAMPDLDEFHTHAYASIDEFVVSRTNPRLNTNLPATAFGCDIVAIEPGVFWMGSTDDETYAEDGEAPLRRVKLSARFWMDACEVTNAQFLEFWAHPQTNMKGETEAEKYGWSFVFELLVSAEVNSQIQSAVKNAEWWIPVPKSDFRHPEGPDTNFNDRLNHPAIHIGWTDATKYCYSHGGRLPTEAEWEYAARGGLHQKKWPWGNEMHPNLTIDGTHSMNIFTGIPYEKDNGTDGYPSTAPVATYAPNGYGLYDMTGNVWEWVNDYWTPRPKAVPEGKRLVDPQGPKEGRDRVMKGGSYMCHPETCRRYRVSGRSHAEADSSTGNLGFRCVYDYSPAEIRKQAQGQQPQQAQKAPRQKRNKKKKRKKKNMQKEEL